MLGVTQSERNAAALTLTEILVILVILGLMATAVVPSVRLIMARARGEDTEQRLRASWQLAAACARAQQRPVVWSLEAQQAECRVRILDAENEALWTEKLMAVDLHAVSDSSRAQAQALSFVMYPHGLTESLTLEWQSDGTVRRLTLGTIVSETSGADGE